MAETILEVAGQRQARLLVTLTTVTAEIEMATIATETATATETETEIVGETGGATRTLHLERGTSIERKKGGAGSRAENWSTSAAAIMRGRAVTATQGHGIAKTIGGTRVRRSIGEMTGTASAVQRRKGRSSAPRDVGEIATATMTSYMWQQPNSASPLFR
jgi:hypothetical protein